jgi:hypothetical protein
VYMASIAGISSLRTVGGEAAKAHLNDCLMHSPWFERFAEGCMSCMGQIVPQNMAVSIPLMLEFQDMLDSEWREATTASVRNLIASIVACSTIAFCGLLRGPKVFLVDLHGLGKYYEELPSHNGQEYVVIPLLGHFKNEVGEQYHLTPLAAVTNSGLQVKTWVQHLIEVCMEEKRQPGPALA